MSSSLVIQTSFLGDTVLTTPLLAQLANRGPVDGLFLVGGSTHPGGGLPMVTLSARIVADRIGPSVR